VACLQPRVGWIFSFWCVLVMGLFTFMAATLVVVEFKTFVQRLPRMQFFLGGGSWNLIWIVMTLAAAKIFHELGDALVCRCCGGDRHEIGVMFLALVPCLHCNVSNAWTFHSRWQRIAVSAAGIHVEIILATVCTFLW